MKFMDWKKKYVRENKLIWFIMEFVHRYFKDNVGKSAAALAYYFVFSFFPFILFVSMVLGFLNIAPLSFTKEIQALIPEDIIEIVNLFLKHATMERSPALLTFALVFSIWFPMRAVNSIMKFVSHAYRVEKKKHFIKHQITVFLYTIFLMFSIFAALIILIVGENLLTFLSGILHISNSSINLWSEIRFLLLAVMLFLVLSILYYVAPDQRFSKRYVLPGALAALVSWLVISGGFAFYVENMANYSVIYGSIGAIIVLLMWLYFSAVTILMGAEFNHVLMMVDEVTF